MKKQDAVFLIEEAIKLLSKRLTQTERQIKDLHSMISQIRMSNSATEEITKKFRVYGN